jgi:hypothetical protein
VQGYIKLWRQIQDTDFWHDEFCRGLAFIDMLMLAAHKPTSVRIRGVRIALKRGQLALSVREAERRWKWNSHGRVNRFLKELEIDTQISTQKNNVCTVVTIINYDKYQGTDTQNGTQTDTQTDTQNGTQTAHKQHTDGTQTATYNNGKNIKNVEEWKETHTGRGEQIVQDSPKKNGENDTTLADNIRIPNRDEIKKWYDEVLFAFEDAPPGISDRATIEANICELINDGRSFSHFLEIVDWVRNAPAHSKVIRPRDGKQLTAAKNWTLWMSKMRDQLELQTKHQEVKRKEARR